MSWFMYQMYISTEECYIIGVTILLGALYFILAKNRQKSDKHKENVVEELKETVREMSEFVIPRKSQRFRKRDRMWFYGRKMMRRVEDNMKIIEDASGRIRNQVERGKLIKKIAKKFIGDSSETGSNGETGEGRPAEDYLEEEDTSVHSWVPAELKYLLSSFHMFGEFDPAIFADIYPAIETIKVSAGQFLFRIGEPDVYIFVVQNGRIDVTISDEAGTAEIKRVGPGETLTSLLSFIDMLTGHAKSFKTVQARAGVDSVVLRLSVEAFVRVFDKSPDLLVRVVQMIMARVQRVVFVALHQYLGLSKELIRSADEMDSAPSTFSLQMEIALAQEGDPDAVLLEAGVLGLQRELALNDVEFLRGVVQVRRLERGDTVMTVSNYSDVALVYVIQGELTMYLLNEDNKDKIDVLYSAHSGECVGQLAMLTGEANFYTCVAQTSTRVALLSKQAFFSIVSGSPESVLSLAQSTIQRLSPLVRRIDFALDWITVEGGRGVVPPVYQPDTSYLVLSGRLRGYCTKKGTRELVGEYSRGDMVGIVDVITGMKRSTSYFAIRDSEICMVPPQLLDYLKSRCSVVTSKLVSILGRRLNNMRTGEDRGSLLTSKSKYNSVAVYPCSPDIPITTFCLLLEKSLEFIGPSVRLSSNAVLKRFGSDAFQSRYDYRLNSWLNQQEDRHNCTIYQCDVSATAWTRKCFRHADIILIVGDGELDSTVSKPEKDIEEITRRIRKELVLLWSPGTLCPFNTRDWLRKRPWLSSHFHIKLLPWVKKIKPSLSEDKQTRQVKKYMAEETDISSDFSRLARHIQGCSIGLVLGGGGARGAAHLGMLRSMLEAGIPIDKVGGVSIGAFMTALWSIHRDIGVITAKSKQWFYNMTRYNGLFDLTYPMTSVFTGSYFNWTLTETFPKELQIEDLWLPFYCVSTDITLSREKVHTSGSLWRYLRASMSYAWILPPICDPKDGHLLLDGCYVNNVPGDVMLQANCSHIIAVDVTAVDYSELTNYGDCLSGWWLLWKKLNPFSSPINIPTQSQIQERLAYCSHYKNLEEVKRNQNYEYIQPPVGHFSSSKFDSFKEIYDVGYHHGTTFFCGLRKAGVSEMSGMNPGVWLPTGDRVRQRARLASERKLSGGDYTFTDLAHLVLGPKHSEGQWKNPYQKSRNSRAGSRDLGLKDEEDSDHTGIWA